MRPEPFSAAAINAVVPRPRHIGRRMSAVEYRAALAKIGAASPARIDLPEANKSYAGRIVQWSDTHIVQKIGAHHAVAHDVGALVNAQEILQIAARGNVTDVRIVYDDQRGSGASYLPSALQARELIDSAARWAARHIVSATSQAAFVERIAVLGRGGQEQRDRYAPVMPAAPPVAPPRMAER